MAGCGLFLCVWRVPAFKGLNPQKREDPGLARGRPILPGWVTGSGVCGLWRAGRLFVPRLYLLRTNYYKLFRKNLKNAVAETRFVFQMFVTQAALRFVCETSFGQQSPWCVRW